jgi:hypothetical protein
MNPLKCAFGVTSGKFLGFVVHEHDMLIDPKKRESISKIGEPVCKKDTQKLLSKINYLRCFISNLAGRVESLLPLVRLKHEEEFTWEGGWGRTEANLRQDQGILGDTSHVTSSKGRKPIQDVHCHTRMGYRSCSTTRRRWQGVSGGIHESTSSRC